MTHAGSTKRIFEERIMVNTASMRIVASKAAICQSHALDMFMLRLNDARKILDPNVKFKSQSQDAARYHLLGSLDWADEMGADYLVVIIGPG